MTEYDHLVSWDMSALERHADDYVPHLPPPTAGDWVRALGGWFVVAVAAIGIVMLAYGVLG